MFKLRHGLGGHFCSPVILQRYIRNSGSSLLTIKSVSLSELTFENRRVEEKLQIILSQTVLDIKN